MNYDANKSFYDTSLRLGALFFGVAIFILLKKRDGTDAMFLMCITFGCAPIVFLVFLKSKLTDSGEVPIVLHRHVGHIMIDALAEICRTVAFSFAIAMISRFSAASPDLKNAHFLEGTSFTLEGFVLAFILFSYLLILFFYSNVGKRERRKLNAVAIARLSGGPPHTPDKATIP